VNERLANLVAGSAIAGEISPMSGLDEYMIHNNPFPVRVMWTSDPRAYERKWFGILDTQGELQIALGMGFYPNIGTADGFAIVNHKGSHHTVRGHRLLGEDRVDMTVGPITIDVVRPFEHLHLSVGDNDFGIRLEIDWYETKRPTYRDYGDQVTDLTMGRPRAGFEGFGRQEGWVEIDGTRIELTPGRFVGSRDHHWGARKGVGGRNSTQYWADHYHSGEFVEFADWGIFADNVFYNVGDERRSSPVRKAERRIRFDPETKMLLGGDAEILLNNGEVKKYSFERIFEMAAFLRCGMYGGYGGRGGTPTGDIWHGQYVGDLVVTGETFDVREPAAQWELSGLDQCMARFVSDGEEVVGIVETENAVVHDAATKGLRGLSVASD
jgi:hypothetical protein